MVIAKAHDGTTHEVAPRSNASALSGIVVQITAGTRSGIAGVATGRRRDLE